MPHLMRTLALVAVAALVSDPTVHTQAHDAAQVLATARAALGGESVLSGIRTLAATGRTRQVRGNNLVPIEFEIYCELPDKYVRRDEFPAQDTDLAVNGFRGDELIGGQPAPARLVQLRQDFARLMLGVFAGSFSSYPLTFRYAAEGEAPEGKADVLDVAGPANFAARFVVQREAHLPVMVMWQAPAGRGAPPAEHRLYYADYRTVNGMKWPFRLRHAVAGTTIEETTFDRVSVNVKIDPRKFEAPK